MNLLARSPVGVDVGTRTLKGVKLIRRGRRVCLDRYFFYDLSKTAESYPESVDTREVLRAAVELTGLRNARVACGMRDSEVINFDFNLPGMTPAQLRVAVGSEISESLSVPIDQLAFDYRLHKNPAAGPAGPAEQLAVQAYCVKREKVVTTCDLMKSAQLQPGAIEPNMLAIAEMLIFNGYTESGSAVLVVDLGESVLSVALLIDDNVQFTKSWTVSFGAINEALRRQLSWSYARAEEFKFSYDFDSDQKASAPEGRIVEAIYTNIFREIRESIQYFQVQMKGGRQIKKICLVGGGSQAKNMARVHEVIFNIPTVAVNPFRNIEIYKDAASSGQEKIGTLAPYMAVAVGLALRGIA